MRNDMMFAVTISFHEYETDVSFVCKTLSDVDYFIKHQLNENNDRNLKSIVIDVVDYFEPGL